MTIKFASGKQVATPAVRQFLDLARVSIFELLWRHYQADWGEAMAEGSRQYVDANLENGEGYLTSAFEVLNDGSAANLAPARQVVVFTTLPDRSQTLIYLAGEITDIAAIGTPTWAAHTFHAELYERTLCQEPTSKSV